MEFEEEHRLNDEDVGTEEELIDLVKACPILYDVRLKVYKDRNMKDSAWRSISEAMKLSVLECKNKWKNIRDAYVKFLHALKEENLTGRKVKKRYKYADKMKFLDRCIQHRTPPGHNSRSRRDTTPQHNSVSMVLNYMDDSAVEVEQQEAEEANEEVTAVNNVGSDVMSPSKSAQEPVKQEGSQKEDVVDVKYGKKRKIDHDKAVDVHQHSAYINEQDDSKLFCLSLISTLKRLDSRKRQLAKLRIQNVLYEVEFSEISGS